MKKEPFVIERTLKAESQRVWEAITSRDQMKEWYFNLEDFRPEPGFKFQFEGGPEDRKYLHLCEVKEVVPGKKISYTWRYDGYPGNTLVSFELFPEGDHTRIRLTHEGLETFPANNPDFAASNFEMGWNEIIGNLLPKYLESKLTVGS